MLPCTTACSQVMAHPFAAQEAGLVASLLQRWPLSRHAAWQAPHWLWQRVDCILPGPPVLQILDSSGMLPLAMIAAQLHSCSHKLKAETVSVQPLKKATSSCSLSARRHTGRHAACQCADQLRASHLQADALEVEGVLGGAVVGAAAVRLKAGHVDDLRATS